MVVRDIPVFCLPRDIPSFIELDISKMELGDSVRIQDIELPEKVSHSTEENYAVISIVGRAKEEEVEEEIGEIEEGAEETAADSAEEATANEE